MGFTFRKSKKIAPGVKLNVGKKSVGISVGGKHIHASANSKGKKAVSASLGHGLSWRKTFK